MDGTIARVPEKIDMKHQDYAIPMHTDRLSRVPLKLRRYIDMAHR